MADDPFGTHPEDFLNRGMKAMVSALPIIGGPVGEFVQYVIGDPAQERRDDFMRDLHARIERLSRQYDEASADRLRSNIQFQATFIQAAQAAARTVQNAKLEMLKNSVLNSAMGTVDENVRLIFMSLIERLTPLHVSLLKLLDDPKENQKAKARGSSVAAGSLFDLVEVAIPELAPNKDFAFVLATELETAKLVDGAGLSVMMSNNGMLSSRTTELGRSFLRFISDPETERLPV